MDDIEKIKKRIERENEKFKNATVMEKRVLIAKDILSLLDQEKIVPEIGTYFEGCFKNVSTQLQDTFFELSSCTVCAIGATFFAAVRRYNNIDSDSVLSTSSLGSRSRFLYISANAMRRFLSTWFDHDTLIRIESTFEAWATAWDGSEDVEAKNMRPLITALKRGESTPEERLRWIMTTIIEQKGDFKPWLAKEYVAWCKQGQKKPSAAEVLKNMKPYKNPPNDQECKDMLGEKE